MRRLGIVVLLYAAPAVADDSKKDSVTVLPWSDASLVFTGGDKSATLEYSQLFGGGYLFYGKASAPLDEDTRIAAFTSDNKLANGFSGSAQLSIDERAAELDRLEEKIKLAHDGVKLLRSGATGQEVPFPVVQAFGAAHADLDMTTNAGILHGLCGKDDQGKDKPCATVDQAKALCAKLGPACDPAHADVDIVVARAKQVAMRPECRALVPGATWKPERDRCFWARWWLADHDLARASDALSLLLVDDTTTKLLWRILQLTDPDDALLKQPKGTDAEQLRQQAQLIADNIEKFEAAVDKLHHASTSALVSRRDLFLTGMLGAPAQGSRAFGVGLDVKYDSLSVHHDDLASKATDDAKYEVTGALDYTYYSATPGLAFNAHVGAGITRDPKAKKTELCTMFPSTDTTVTGKNCDPNALYRTGPAPDAESAVFARLALTYQYGVASSEDEVIPGIELRAAYERHGTDDAVGARLTLFGTPVKGTTAARVGVALDVAYAINIGDADSRWAITPLVFIGATFSQLEGGSL